MINDKMIPTRKAFRIPPPRETTAREQFVFYPRNTSGMRWGQLHLFRIRGSYEPLMEYLIENLNGGDN